MFPCQWIFATLTVLMVLAFIWWYWKSIYPPSQPSPPPLASLQGMPPELRNQVYELVVSNTSLRIISGEKLVAAYQALHVKNYPKFERTGLKWYVGGTPNGQHQGPCCRRDLISASSTSTPSHQQCLSPTACGIFTSW